jgi:hypothetical protein
MKLMDVNHISVLPFLTCNFHCPYCIAYQPALYKDKKPFGLWEERFDEVFKFIKKLDKRMILCSGGEPLLWRRWEELIKGTDHYWYFVTNTSVIPKWLEDREIKSKVKLILSAFHRTGMSINKYIHNVRVLQDRGYPIFTKIMYVKDEMQLKEASVITKCDIPMSFTPVVGLGYSKGELEAIKPYCQSEMYYHRFIDITHKADKCIAGTRDSFQVDGLALTRCGHYSSISLNSVPKLLRGLHNGYIGDVSHQGYYKQPKMCHKAVCFCENFNFGGILDDSENPRWQKFIDTGVWN